MFESREWESLEKEIFVNILIYKENDLSKLN